MQSFFITSSGTHIGKTLLTSTLCWQLKQAGKKVTALKPVISGYDPKDETSDPAQILAACGLAPSQALIETISPWRFRAPFSPNIAAVKDGKPPVPFEKLVAFCREHEELDADALVVEGVGGVMVPLDDKHTVLDWMEALSWPVILVVGSYLGSISHTLTAVEALRGRGLSLRALVVSQSKESDVSLEDTVATLQKFISQDVPIVKLPRTGKADAWKHMPLISWIAAS